jgi:membrane-bound ClpP family serine protease
MELRIAGLFLLLAGWLLMLAAILMLSALPLQTSFSLAGLAVELLGLLLLARSHIPPRKKHDA